MIDYVLYGSWSCTHPDRPQRVSAIFKSKIPFLPPVGLAVTVCEHVNVPPLEVVEVSWNHGKGFVEIQAAFSSPEDFITDVRSVLFDQKVKYTVEE
jgi:hypothetical protein